MVKWAVFVMVMFPLSVLTQISGKVILMDSRQPAIGATIVASDGSKAISGFDGSFSLPPNFPNKTILITSFNGYKSDTTEIVCQSDIYIYLISSQRKNEPEYHTQKINPSVSIPPKRVSKKVLKNQAYLLNKKFLTIKINYDTIRRIQMMLHDSLEARENQYYNIINQLRGEVEHLKVIEAKNQSEIDKYKEDIFINDEELKDEIVKESSLEIYSFVDEDPEYPGGYAAMMAFIQKNFHYPQVAIENNIQGKCYVKFIVSANGCIGSVQVERGIRNCPECDKEAVRVIRMMSGWLPGKINGKSVSTLYRMPINFALE
jgi:protein TonB